LTIEHVDLPTFTSLFYGDAPVEERPNLFWWGWWPDYNDAWNHLYPQVACATRSPNGGNVGFYCDAAVDALLAEAKDAATDLEYTEAIAAVQQIVSHDDPPAIYYLQPKWITVLRKDVTGFVFNPVNIGTYHFWKLRRQP
jgi:peptide/nickel transport system substrate-binding protein